MGCSAPLLLFSFLSTATPALSCCRGQRMQRRWGSPVSAALWEGATAGWGGGKCYTAAAAGLADGEPVIRAPSPTPAAFPVPAVGPALVLLPVFSLPQPPSPYRHRALTLSSSHSHEKRHLMLVTGFCRFSSPCEQGHKIKNKKTKNMLLKGSRCVVSLSSNRVIRERNLRSEKINQIAEEK